MACNCIEALDEQLAERNTRLSTLLVLSDPQGVFPYIATEQIERGRWKPKAVTMFPTFCPFCGIRYRPDDVIRSAVA